MYTNFKICLALSLSTLSTRQANSKRKREKASENTGKTEKKLCQLKKNLHKTSVLLFLSFYRVPLFERICCVCTLLFFVTQCIVCRISKALHTFEYVAYKHHTHTNTSIESDRETDRDSDRETHANENLGYEWKHKSQKHARVQRMYKNRTKQTH